MRHEDLSTMLRAETSAVNIAQWLRSDYLPELIDRFNTDECRKRLGLYQGERIPENERNLTDVRNRVSLIVEYELARLSNQILNDAGQNDLFWSYVVANRFPDLEVRRRDGTRCLRIEVKCLQSISEEKSANFDTLKKDINPSTDFVVVFVWEWGYSDSLEFGWDRAPRILNSYVFHAMSLAALRDAYWLNRPSNISGAGFQGFDLRFAVNCVDGIYSEEEGNYGKLLRIWQPNFPYPPPTTPDLIDTEQEYLRFKKGVVADGFWNLCRFYLPKLSNQAPLTDIEYLGQRVGSASGEFAFFFNELVNPKHIKILMATNDIRYGVSMTAKYACTGYTLDGQDTLTLFRQTKPKRLLRQLFGLAEN